jgi:hypothetical protein
MTGVMIETTDAMTEVATMDGIADEVTIVMIITEAMIGIAAYATITDRASSQLQSDIFNCGSMKNTDQPEDSYASSG